MELPVGKNWKMAASSMVFFQQTSRRQTLRQLSIVLSTATLSSRRRQQNRIGLMEEFPTFLTVKPLRLGGTATTSMKVDIGE